MSTRNISMLDEDKHNDLCIVLPTIYGILLFLMLLLYPIRKNIIFLSVIVSYPKYRDIYYTKYYGRGEGDLWVKKWKEGKQSGEKLHLLGYKLNKKTRRPDPFCRNLIRRRENESSREERKWSKCTMWQYIYPCIEPVLIAIPIPA